MLSGDRYTRGKEEQTNAKSLTAPTGGDRPLLTWGHGYFVICSTSMSWCGWMSTQALRVHVLMLSPM